MISRLTVFAVCLWALGPATAADYFVSPTGDDANGDGSVARPFRTPEKALALAGPGDTVVLRGGEYRLAEPLRFPRGGERDRPLTLKAQEGEYAALLGSVRLTGWELHDGNVWKCKAPPALVKGLYEDAERLVHPRQRGKREDPPVAAIRAPGRWTQQGGWVYLWTREGDSPDNHRIEASQHGIVNLNQPWLRLEELHLFFGQATGLVLSADHCVAERCEVAHVSNSVDNAYGAYFSGCSDSVLRDCVVHDSYYWGDHGSNSHVVSCINCGDRGPNFVERCEIFNGGLGVGTKGAAREMVIRDCHVYDLCNGIVTSGERSAGPGAGKIDRGHYVIYRNRIRDCARGIYFYSGDTHSNRVLNNVIERCGAGVYMRKVRGVPDRPLVVNNVFSQCGAALYLVAGRDGTETLSQFAEGGLRSHHNLFADNTADWRNPLTWGKDFDQTFAEVQDFHDHGWEAGSIDGDPLLDEWGRAKPGSPTLRAGATVPLPPYIEPAANQDIGLGPWHEGEAPPDPGMTLSIAGTQGVVTSGQEIELRAVLTNGSPTEDARLEGDALVTFHFRYANVWYRDRQELWRCRLALPARVLRPGEALELTGLDGWRNPTDGDLGSEFHLRADDRYWQSGCRLRATLGRVPRSVPTNEALQQLGDLVRSKEVLPVKVSPQ